MSTLKSILAAAVCLLAIGGPAYAMPIDPLGPIVSTTKVQDLRSPDSREVPASKPETTFAAVDLRSPDAVTGTGAGNPNVVVVDAPKPVFATGFDWSDGALGAGILALAMLAAGAAYTVVRHRPVTLA
jgi:hypothetical protein